MPIPHSARGQYVQLTLTNQTLRKYDSILHNAALRRGEKYGCTQQVGEDFSKIKSPGCSAENK